MDKHETIYKTRTKCSFGVRTCTKRTGFFFLTTQRAAWLVLKSYNSYLTFLPEIGEENKSKYTIPFHFFILLNQTSQVFLFQVLKGCYGERKRIQSSNLCLHFHLKLPPIKELDQR